MMKLLTCRIESPLGTIILVVDRDRLCALDFGDRESRMIKLLHKRYPSFELVESKLPEFSNKVRAYLDGDYGSLEDIPLNAGEHRMRCDRLFTSQSNRAHAQNQ